MKKQSIIFFILISVLGILAKVDAEILTPNINSITPTSFSTGETISISGENFGNFEKGSYYNRLCFGYEEGEIISWNNNQINVTVPDSVYYINYGNDLGIYTIQNDASWGTSCGSAEGTRSNYFTNYVIKPKITSFYPSKVIPGGEVDVSGDGFGSAQGTVLVNGMSVDINSWDSFSISFNIPNISAESVDVVIKTYDDIESDDFTLVILGAPEITSISPQIRKVGDDSVSTIYGSGFGEMTNEGFGVYIVDNDGKIYRDDSAYGSTPYKTLVKSWSDNKIELLLNIPGCVSFENDLYDKVYGPCFYIQPEIVSLSINTGVVGDKLILNSSRAHNFTSVIPNHEEVLNHGAEIYFNNVKGVIKEISDYEIVTSIPENAKSGNIKLIYRHNGTSIESIGTYLEILQPTAQDDLSAYQQYLQQAKVDQAWNYSHGSSDVTVAVIDDGVYTGHPDLDSNMWINSDEIEGNNRDDDNNGYVDDRWGWDFVTNSKDMTTLGTHGTMVAGIIGSESNNNTGITGINWNVKLMPIIACDDTGCDSGAIKKAIRYAVDNGADIINLSLGGGVFNYTDNYNEVIKYAFDRNVLVVISAGNGDLEGGIGRNLDITKVSPVCNDGNQNMVLGVGAVDANNQLTTWSNYGGCADIYAPGKDIVSTAVPAYSTLNGFYDSADGTSFSAPIVSGIAALIKAKYPTIKNTAIRDRIINNYDYQNGRKIVNAYKAISQSFSDSEKNTNNVPVSTPTPQNINNNTTNIINNTVEQERKLITKIDNSLSKRVSGNILLQVEKNGEGWYVYPDNKKKYYLGRPADAFSIMRNLGLGVKHSELAGYLTAKFPSRLSGKIMLDVEQNGEAYYINPNDLKGYYLNRPADAFRIMRELGLGITNTDIRKIDVGEVE